MNKKKRFREKCGFSFRRYGNGNLCESVATSVLSVYMHKMFIFLYKKSWFDVAYSKNGSEREKELSKKMYTYEK